MGCMTVTHTSGYIDALLRVFFNQWSDNLFLGTRDFLFTAFLPHLVFSWSAALDGKMSD